MHTTETMAMVVAAAKEGPFRRGRGGNGRGGDCLWWVVTVPGDDGDTRTQSLQIKTRRLVIIEICTNRGQTLNLHPTTRTPRFPLTRTCTTSTWQACSSGLWAIAPERQWNGAGLGCCAHVRVECCKHGYKRSSRANENTTTQAGTWTSQPPDLPSETHTNQLLHSIARHKACAHRLA